MERLDLSENRLTHALPSEIGQLSSITHLLLNNNQPGLGNRYEGGQWGRDQHPHAERFIPTELGDATALQVLELSNNSFGGTPPAFLFSNTYLAPPQAEVDNTTDAAAVAAAAAAAGAAAMQTYVYAGVGGNPYYCPLTRLHLDSYAAVSCLPCPNDPPNADGTYDFTAACYGHGDCIDGEYCRCAVEWSLEDDCSKLSCPISMVDGDGGETVEQICNGRGSCYNTVNASLYCPDGLAAADCPDGPDCLASAQPWIVGAQEAMLDAEGFGIQDFVAFHADCQTGEVTFARCECEGGVPPSCSLTVEASEEATRLSSAPPRRRAPAARLLSLGLAVLGAWAVRGRLAG